MKNVRQGDPIWLQRVQKFVAELPDNPTQEQLKLVWDLVPDALGFQKDAYMQKVAYAWVVNMGMVEVQLGKGVDYYGYYDARILGVPSALKDVLMTLSLDKLRCKPWFIAKYGTVGAGEHGMLHDLHERFSKYLEGHVTVGNQWFAAEVRVDMNKMLDRLRFNLPNEAIQPYLLWFCQGGTLRLRDEILPMVGVRVTPTDLPAWNAFTTLDSAGLHFREEVLKDGIR